jgi:polyisoprenoid-binding protein YceI
MTPNRLILALVAILAIGVGGYLAYDNVLRGDDTAPLALATPDPSDAATAPPTAAASAAASTEPSTTTSDGSVAGTWSVTADSQAGYRVRERLANLSSTSEAVGRTTQVTGTMQVAGDEVRAVRVEADLRGLQSDEGRRDNAIRQRGLESERFPTAVFELAEPIRLDQEPVSGRQVNGQGKGRLSIHGVTREVTANLEGRWDGSSIQVAGRMPVRMTDFQIQPPTVGPVLSIEDGLTVEFRLTFVPA